jgi:hypothetical protein
MAKRVKDEATRVTQDAGTISELPFDVILEDAEERIWSVFRRSTRLRHRGTKGRVREEGVARFLRQQLPNRFSVYEGEAMDTEDRRSTQLDVIVFDGANVSPLWIDEDLVLIPAESLLAAIEVKTRVTRDEYKNCCRAVRSLSELEPHGEPFIPARKLGAAADDSRLRCLYSIVAFGTDLANDDWARKEWTRFLEVCAEEEVEPSRFDRILVLGHGLIVPPNSTVREVSAGSDKALLGRWFLHLSQFLTREAGRRRPFEWTPYRDQRKGWTRLTPEAPTLATGDEEESVRPGPKGRPPAARRATTGQRSANAVAHKRRNQAPRTAQGRGAKQSRSGSHPSESKPSGSATPRRGNRRRSN